MQKTNPLIDYQSLPPFHVLKPEFFYTALEFVIQENQHELNQLLENYSVFNWQNLMTVLESHADRIDRGFGVLAHLNSVVSTPELRGAYQQCIELVSEYSSQLAQNEKLFAAMNAMAHAQEFYQLSQARQKTIKNELRDFRLAGVHLSADKKARYREIQRELAKITHRFEENLLNATDEFNKHILDESLLSGLPEDARTKARLDAEQKGLSGYLLNLEAPCYLAVRTYADHRPLREEIYQAYVTRASELGSAENDNTNLIYEILQLRHELANLLDFQNYAGFSLATKMAKNANQVISFLRDLANRAKPHAHQEMAELKEFAEKTYGVAELASWDIAYYSEKLRQHAYALSQEELRPYFPENKVIGGLFELVGKLYGVEFEEITNVPKWHDDVRFFAIRRGHGDVCGYFYLDLYARAQKRSGAWVDDCINLRQLDEHHFQRPVVYVICNFPAGVEGKPALWSHDDVTTLFHEFGHALHHLLTKVDASFVAGTHGVPWDAVELPSQFMENFCYEKAVLDMVSGHYQTGEKISAALFAKIQKARHFQTGMYMVRQIIYSLFDFRLHMEFSKEKDESFIQQILNELRDEYAVEPIAPYNRFQHSFSHIFAGGYAAGYYSYKWAEVLSSDAFSRFEEEGLFNPKVAAAFQEYILSKGGSAEPEELFIAFRGRKPDITPLLRHSGLL